MAIKTIKDVAREAGVSISTVSAVLNGSKPVSEELSARVRSAIEKLDFHPNHMARSINARQTRTLAFLTPDIANVSFQRIFRAVDAITRDRGYSLFLLNTEGSVEITQRAIQRVVELKMDGAFLTLTWALTQPDANVSLLAQRDIAAVGVFGAYPIEGIDCFVWDEEDAGGQIGRYLNRLGHRDILCVGPVSSRSADKRWNGLRSAFEPSNSRISIAETKNYTPDAGYDAMEKAIATSHPFSAVVAFNDAIATGALAALNDQRMLIPQTVSFVSFGDHHRDFFRPKVTSMSYDEEGVARLAAEKLLLRIEHGASEPTQHHYLPLRLSIQQSTSDRPTV